MTLDAVGGKKESKLQLALNGNPYETQWPHALRAGCHKENRLNNRVSLVWDHFLDSRDLNDGFRGDTEREIGRKSLL